MAKSPPGNKAAQRVQARLKSIARRVDDVLAPEPRSRSRSRRPPQPAASPYKPGWLGETGRLKKTLEGREVSPPGSAIRVQAIKQTETWQNLTVKELEEQMAKHPEAAVRNAAAEQWFIAMDELEAAVKETEPVAKINGRKDRTLYLKNQDVPDWHHFLDEDTRKTLGDLEDQLAREEAHITAQEKQQDLLEQLYAMKDRMRRKTGRRAPTSVYSDPFPLKDKPNYAQPKRAPRDANVLAALEEYDNAQRVFVPPKPYTGPIKMEAPKIAPPPKGEIFCENCKFFPAAPKSGSIYREPGNNSSNLCEFCRSGEDG